MSREQKRDEAISKVVSSLKKSIEERKKFILEKLIILIMSNLNVSRRTAMEYIDVAIYRLGKTKDEIFENIKNAPAAKDRPEEAH